MTQEEKHYDDNPKLTESAGGGVAMTSNQPNLGGLGGFDVQGIGSGPAVRGKGGVGVGVGTGTHPGSGGDGYGFGGRTGNRKAMLGSGGGTRQSERAMAAVLNWLARHQSLNGSWNLVGYKTRCKDSSCSGDAKAGDYDPRLPPWHCCRSSAPAKRISRGDTNKPSKRAWPSSSITRSPTATCGWGRRCMPMAWRRSSCANAMASAATTR